MRSGPCLASKVHRLIVEGTPGAYSVAMGLTRNSEESKELVQEAAYRLLQREHRYDSARDGRAWLKVVVRNLFIDSRRAVERRNGVSLDCPVVCDGTSLAETLPSADLDIHERCERDEERRAVRRIVGRLRRPQKEVLMMCDIRSMSYKEAAQALALPEGTLRSRLHRARRSFRNLWDKEQATRG